jgi:hypothetical protein
LPFLERHEATSGLKRRSNLLDPMKHENNLPLSPSHDVLCHAACSRYTHDIRSGPLLGRHLWRERAGGLDGATTTTADEGNQSEPWTANSRSGGANARLQRKEGEEKRLLDYLPMWATPATYTSRQGLNQWGDVSTPPHPTPAEQVLDPEHKQHASRERCPCVRHGTQDITQR